ncbi:hypothetical protein PhCBS80983_g02395 [Powellomyces hirtus]|uniref:DNA primase large subunit n=1 Tax=Powellomyces hirtus TaxID=109895 RepID=A0A507E8Q4_9FUNG|nr:hypothetical protein PhCBS80983_g02395 [Powellomyces hirtus]
MLKQNRHLTASATNAHEVTRHNDPRLGPYPSSLNFYTVPPPYELTLMEFETYALDRLRVLKAVETAFLRAKKPDAVDRFIQTAHDEHMHLNRNVRINGVGAAKLYQERRKDHISHFILRLAYCRTPDLRRWLVKQETALFMYRFRQEEKAERTRFIQDLNLDMPVVSNAERASVATELRFTHGWSRERLENTTFYRVPFENVLRLVARQKVFVKHGWAYVPERDQPVLIANAFRSQLTAALEATAKAVPRMDEDDRLIPVLSSIAKQYLSNTYAPATEGHKDRVKHNEVDGLVGHFPPCMRNLHSALRRDAHLKHVARLQFGLFLKGIGMPLEEALIFWRTAFHRMTDDQFTKGYAYNVRYNYGLEGKRTNYTPYSCIKIITSNQPGPTDNHGCPFKEFSKNDLKLLMKSYGVEETAMTDIAKLTKDGHYQVACTRLYEATRGNAHRLANASLEKSKAEANAPLVQTVEHPNQWFDMSRISAAQSQPSRTKPKNLTPAAK